MGDLPSPLTFSALSEPSADVSREYRRDGAEDWQTPESVLDALRQPRDPSKSGVAAELAAVSVRPHVRASSTISLADVNAAIAKNAVQTGEVNVPRDFGPAREQIVHEATPLRQGPDHWVSFVKSAREVGPGDVLEVVTRGDRPARLAAVVDHVVSAVRDESGWTSEVAHRLVHTGELSELLSKYPAAGTNSCVRLELRARTFKLPTAAFREAKLGASLLASDKMHYVTKNRTQAEPELLPSFVSFYNVPYGFAAQHLIGSLRPEGERIGSDRRDWLYDVGEKVTVATREDVERLQGYTVQFHEPLSASRYTGRVLPQSFEHGWPRREMSIRQEGDRDLTLCWPVEVFVAARPDDEVYRAAPMKGPPRVNVHDEITLSPSNVTPANLDRIAAPMSAAPCSTCMGAKVLRHIDPAYADELCPDCPPVEVKGPCEWTLIKETVTLKWAADESTRIVRFAKLNHETAFQITALDRATWAYPVARPATDHPVMRIEGECCPDMMIARLLVALRDGTVTP